jgi:YmgG-like glycine-zipper protein
MEHERIWRSHKGRVGGALAMATLLVLLLTGSPLAQDIYAYPAKGQSQTQQDRDRYECHSWAVKQTGFDPSRAQGVASGTGPASNQPPAQAHVVKGAARGAALGVVGGAIAGNAGKGAAAGAAMGGLAGGMRRRDQKIQQNQQQQVNAQAAANSQQNQRNAYHRAMAACLTGRGYTVN